MGPKAPKKRFTSIPLLLMNVEYTLYGTSKMNTVNPILTQSVIIPDLGLRDYMETMPLLMWVHEVLIGFLSGKWSSCCSLQCKLYIHIFIHIYIYIYMYIHIHGHSTNCRSFQMAFQCLFGSRLLAGLSSAVSSELRGCTTPQQ